MAYQLVPVTSVDEIPGVITAFAASLGFSTGPGNRIRHPTYAGALAFELSVLRSGSAAALRERVRVWVVGSPDNASATAESPKLNRTVQNTATAVEVMQPTGVHLIGHLEGGPPSAGRSFIAAVIEYGFNLYRHLYLGYVEKITDFAGGEVIAGSSQWTSGSVASGNIRADSAEWSGFPFSMKHPFADPVGCVHVDHPANAVPFRTFYNTRGGTQFDDAFAAHGGNCVLGGWSDSINSGLLNAAKSPYSGAQILVPINLYIGKREGNTQTFQAIGAPAGVRLVHMEDLEPGARVTVGSSEWVVFPVFSKQASFILNIHSSLSTANSLPTHNTSQYVGQAYLVSD